LVNSGGALDDDAPHPLKVGKKIEDFCKTYLSAYV